jgi:hypothetical protein
MPARVGVSESTSLLSGSSHEISSNYTNVGKVSVDAHKPETPPPPPAALLSSLCQLLPAILSSTPHLTAWTANIYILTSIALLLSILLGVVFYSTLNQWPYSTSLLCSTSALLGPVYNIPSQPPEHKTVGDWFTLCLFLWGQTLLVYSITVAVAQLVASSPTISFQETTFQERMKLTEMDVPEDADGDGKIGMYDYMAFQRHNFVCRVRYWVNWGENKTMYCVSTATVAWILIGLLYGMLYEGWDFKTSLYFVIDAVIEEGLAEPNCIPLSDDDDVDADPDSNCAYGVFRGTFLSLFLIVGCPLFGLFTAQFAGAMIARAIRERERVILHTPLTKDEYVYAANLYGDDELLSLGEFTILELLRLQRVTRDDLEQIKMLYDAIDENSSGAVDEQMLLKRNFMEEYGNFVEEVFDDGFAEVVEEVLEIVHNEEVERGDDAEANAAAAEEYSEEVLDILEKNDITEEYMDIMQTYALLRKDSEMRELADPIESGEKPDQRANDEDREDRLDTIEEGKGPITF